MLLIGDNIASAPIHMMLRVKRAYEGLSDSQVADIIGCSIKDVREFEVGKKCLPEKYHQNLELYLFNKSILWTNMVNIYTMMRIGIIDF